MEPTMDQCPKCNGCDISGPQYVKSAYGNESLRYRCNRCGYERDKACADAEPVKGGQRAYSHQEALAMQALHFQKSKQN
jgi:hypothetical protein